MSIAPLSSFWNLGRLRLTVQLVMLFLTVYGGAFLGHYASDKLSTALPALSCAYDKQNTAYCMLVPLQHQLDHRVGAVIARGEAFAIKTLLPVGITIGTYLLFFLFLGKAFCAWICPLGTAQELIGKLGRLLRISARNLTERQTLPVRRIKWLMLGVLVLGLPLAAGLNWVPHAYGDPFCQVCPSRLLTTLITGDAEQLSVRHANIHELALGTAGNVLFGLMLVAALSFRQPFCRICPMLAANALAQRIGLLRLSKPEQHAACDKCGICTKACPMDIPEIHHEHGRKAFNEDCTLCGRCAEYCPQDGVISLRFGPWSVFRSGSGYYRRRVREELPDGTPKRSVFWMKPVATGNPGR